MSTKRRPSQAFAALLGVVGLLLAGCGRYEFDRIEEWEAPVADENGVAAEVRYVLRLDAWTGELCIYRLLRGDLEERPTPEAFTIRRLSEIEEDGCTPSWLDRLTEEKPPPKPDPIEEGMDRLSRLPEIEKPPEVK